MGMYTGLRVKVMIKEEYRPMIQEINEGYEWMDFTDQFPFLKEFAFLGRAGFIPGGVLSYMPDSWEKGNFPNQTPTDGFENNFDMGTGFWTFQCSLKNYENEIQQFLESVLSVIISESEHIEVLYEEWEESILYEFVEGKIQNSGKTIKYRVL